MTGNDLRVKWVNAAFTRFLDNVFTGVPLNSVIEKAKPKADAAYVMCHSEAGFTVRPPST